MAVAVQEQVRKRRWWGELWRRCEGAALIEFVFAAPILITAVGGVIELGMIMFVDSLLEGGVREASRLGLTGYTPAGVSRTDYITQAIVANSAGLIQPADITITTLVYSNFNSVGQPEPYVDANGNGKYDAGESFTDVNGNGQWDADMGKSGLGGPGDVVVYTATVDWHMLTHLMDPIIGQGGAITLTASTTVRNEPWGNNGPQS